MHICLPDTREVRPANGGSTFLLYNVHIDGLYHCSLRYKQLLHLHQTLSKKFNYQQHQLPPFPPKKLLPLSMNQTEERRQSLEKYLQCISQDKTISNSSIFNLFLLEAQLESTRIKENQVHLDVELVNGQKIRLQIKAHDSADSVLQSICRILGLKDRYHAYFCLCLCGYDVIRDKLIIKRRLSFFESPYVTLQMAIQQQEQLQNVLNTTTSSVNQSAVSISNINNNNNNCRCQSCSQQLQSNPTSVPLIGSSSSGGANVNSNNNNRYQQQLASHYNNSSNFNHDHHHHQLDRSNNTNDQYHYSPMPSNHHHTTNHQHHKNHLFVTHRILLRKSYWDPIYDTYILNDQQALNLLFIQTVYDIKHSLMFVDRDTYHQLESLLASDSKLEYILLARTLKYYNHVHFEPCYSDYPRPRTKVMISIGSKELNMRVLKSPTRRSFTSSSSSSSTVEASSSTAPLATANSQQAADSSNRSQSNQVLYCTSSLIPSNYQHLITKEDLVEEEYNFKVPLIRCWRLTSLETLNSNNNGSNNANVPERRKSSLSLLFGNTVAQENRQATNSGSNCNGTGGVSLLAALAGRNGHTNRVINKTNCQQQRQQQTIDHDLVPFSQYELSFEYLISKDTLKWITISSDQAIFISISLQGVVDELVSKRDGKTSSLLYHSPLIENNENTSTTATTTITSSSSLASTTTPGADSNNNNSNCQQTSFTYLYRDGTQKLMNTSNQKLIDKFGTTLGYSPMNSYSLALARQRQQVRAATSALLFPSSPPSSSTSVGSYFSSLSSSLSTTTPILASSNGQHSGFSYSNQSTLNHGNYGNGYGFEISNLKKAPSPIINDAFEGVTNLDDDL